MKIWLPARLSVIFLFGITALGALGQSTVETSGGTAGTIPYFKTSTDIENSAIFQSGTGASATIGIGTTAPTSTLEIATPQPVFTNTQVNEYVQSLLHGETPYNVITKGGADTCCKTTDALTGAIQTPVDATVTNSVAVAGYAESLCNSDSRTHCNTAAGYFSAWAHEGGAAVWGINPVVSDQCPTCLQNQQLTGTAVIGQETDINIYGTPNMTRGITVELQGTGDMSGTDGGIGLEILSGNPIDIKWPIGLQIDDSATTYAAIDIGASSAQPSNGSQYLVFTRYNSAGTRLSDAYMREDQNGNLPITVPSGQAVEVLGNLTVTGTKNFKIDHPLDPANKYLYHTSVESPDMMNIYNGNVVLNSNGEAEIQLPDWFEALNQDFRYQLTCIGGFAPVYVAREIENNSFRIAGGIRGLKVSWQVTGIRNDAYAKAHRSPVEVEKSSEERGRYLHPELFGASKGSAIGVH